MKMAGNSLRNTADRIGRSSRGLLVCVVLVVGTLALSVTGCGSDSLPTTQAQTTELEDQALAAYREDKLRTARRLAEEVLRANPSSMVGHFVLGSVLRQSDGLLPSSMYHLGQARRLYENTWTVAPAPPEAPWQMHREIVYGIQEVAQELEAHDYRLTMIEFYDALYQPDLSAQRAWTLLQLGRLDDAREYAARARQSSDPDERSQGLNVACAIEARAAERDARAEACQAAFEYARARRAENPTTDVVNAVNVTVHAYNAALALLGQFQPNAAEEALQQGAANLSFTPANPWRLLTLMYLSQGRSHDALNALVEMARWRDRQPAWLQDQDRAETLAVRAIALLAAGRAAPAVAAIEQAAARPDRRGLTSGNAEQAAGSHAAIRRAARRLAEVEAAERAAFGDAPEVGWMARIEESTRAIAADWADRQRIRTALSDADVLTATVSPWRSGGLDPMPAWMARDWVEAAGAGVVLRAVNAAAAAEAGTTLGPQAMPHYDAVRAEAYAARGRLSDARTSARAAYNELPGTEALLRARMAWLIAQGHLDDGNRTDGLAWAARALQLDPGVLRRDGAALPARFEVEGALADLVRAGLDDVPTFRPDGAAFLLRVQAATAELRFCLVTAANDDLGCVSIAREEDDADDAAFVQRAGPQALQDLFSLPLQLRTIDLGSLDGRTSVSSSQTREALQEALDRITTPPAPRAPQGLQLPPEGGPPR